MDSWTEAQFDEAYTLVDDQHGQQNWDWPDVKAAGIPNNRYWAVTEGDCNTLWANPGMRVVNVLYFWVTEEPWPEGQPDVQLETDPVCSECGFHLEEHADLGQDDVGPHEWKECE